jgi:DNA polymerase I-like protein with 3'-5' exonuclease and polymerase domains
VDCETTLIDFGQYLAKKKSRITPQSTPDIVLGSIAGGGEVRVVSPEMLAQELASILCSSHHVVFHNASFDIPVILKRFPELKKLFVRAISEHRVHDTKILEQLTRIAAGHAQKKDQLHSGLKLKDLAKRYANIDLDKDQRRVTFGDWLGRPEELPQGYLEYAAEDAYATHRVYAVLRKKARRLASLPSRFKSLPDAQRRFGDLAETIQLGASVAFDWMDGFPLRVDLEAARAETSKYEAKAAQYEERLIALKWAHRTPKTKQFKLKLKKIREVIKEYAIQNAIQPELSATGLVSLKYKFWRQHLDPFDPTAEPTTDAERLGVWMGFSRIRKFLSTYLHVYDKSETHYSETFTIGARTTRTASRHPNTQFIPKRSGSLRHIFVPAPGWDLYELDYKAAEMVALAQQYFLLYGGSVLGDAINAGDDMHVKTASRVFGDLWAGSDASDQKTLRQAAKAVNFGLPGGMGATTFSSFARGYGVFYDIDEAKHLRKLALQADPELARYLTDAATPFERLALAAKNLGMGLEDLVTALGVWRSRDEGLIHERLAFKRLREWARGERDFPINPRPGFNPKWDLFREDSRTMSGMIRGRSSYTEAHNFPFQAGVADGSKLGIFTAWAHWTPDAPWRPIAFVHDSLLLEVREGASEGTVEAVRGWLVAGMEAICPRIRVDIDVVGPMKRWSEA